MGRLNQILLRCKLEPKFCLCLSKRTVLLCLLVFCPSVDKLIASWDLEKGGSFKSIFGVQLLRQQGIFERQTNPFNEERLRLHGAVSNRYLRLEFANETSLNWQRPNAATITVPDFSPSSAWNANWTLLERREISITDRIDRAFIQLTLRDVQFIVGKQVIATGVGQIFTAISQVQRYPFLVIDPEYQKTEDAVSVIWSGPLQLEARFLPKSKEQREQNFHFRAKGSKGGYDVALTAGKTDDKTFIGLETAGNLGEALLRGELVGYDQRGTSYVQGLLGVDYVFSATWSAKIEGFYNGFGQNSDYTFSNFIHRSAPFRGRWYGALLVTWEIHPLLKSNLLSVVNLQDPSALFHFYLNYSLANSVDVLLGQFLSTGGPKSEYGGRLPLVGNLEIGQPDITYLAVRYYF